MLDGKARQDADDGQLTNTSSALLHFDPFLTLKERQQELARYLADMHIEQAV